MLGSTGTIMVVEDEERVRDLLRLYLEKDGFHVEMAVDGEEAINRIPRVNPDLILLDIMLPKFDGLTVCREIRKKQSTPIIMLTAKGEELDRVLGLEIGADDYIAKPFSTREVVARIKAVLRRTRQSEEKDLEAINFPGLTINNSSKHVELDSQIVQMPPKEFELLWFLASNPGRVYTREQLLQYVWNYDYDGDTRTVDTHIKRLRNKISLTTGRRYIETVWGHGYKFEAKS